MQNLKKSMLALAVLSSLCGCAATSSPPRDLPEAAPRSAARAQKVAEVGWTDEALVKEGRPYLVLVTPMTPPAELKAKVVNFSLESGSTIKDLAAVMSNLGYSVIMTDDKVGAREFYLPRYKGTLGNLMSAVSRSADVWFTWQDGVLQISGKERVVLSMPQDEGLADKIKKGLVELGVVGEDSMVSFQAGMLTADLKPSQLKKVKSFLERMTSNAALVSLQVAIVTVNLNQNSKQGVDWSRMQMAIGKNNTYALNSLSQEPGALNGSNTLSQAAQPQPTTTTTNGVTTTTTATTTTPTTGGIDQGILTANQDVNQIAKNLGNTVLLSGGGLRAVATNSIFSLIGFVDFLNDYGVTETKQNVMLKTVTGNKVKLKSVTQIPYVSSVSVGSTGTSGAAGGTGGGGLLAGAKTATANDGITLEMLPSFDAFSNTVSVSIDLSIQAVVGNNTLSAGSQLGSLSQPTTAERAFNDIIRVRPGQTVVVGGLTYDSIGDSRSAPSFLADSVAEHKTLSVNRLTMFIVVRPTITMLGALAEKEGDEMFPEDVSVQHKDKPAKKLPVKG